MSMTAGEMFCVAKGKLNTKFGETKGSKDTVPIYCIRHVLYAKIKVKGYDSNLGFYFLCGKLEVVTVYTYLECL